MAYLDASCSGINTLYVRRDITREPINPEISEYGLMLEVNSSHIIKSETAVIKTRVTFHTVCICNLILPVFNLVNKILFCVNIQQNFPEFLVI